LPLGKKRKKSEPDDARPKSGLVLVKDGVKREVTFEELALSNTLSLEALVRVLSRNGNVDPNELMEEMEKVKEERFREGAPPEGMPPGDEGVAH
jgi:hypothetical protein